MPLELLTVPCLSDNYAFLLHSKGFGQTALIDAPEAAPIAAALDARGWRLTDILLTHHHGDHIDGVAGLRHPGVRVIGAAADAHRLPPLDLAVVDGDQITVCGETADVLDVSGHTVGHLAFHFPTSGFAFTADSLMALGCGRLSEGTATQMWASLLRLRALPSATLICSGHEYTATNARFAATIETSNDALTSRVATITAARSIGEPTVPSTLAMEIATNPFLRADVPAVQAAVGMADADPVTVFAEIRRRKDKF